MSINDIEYLLCDIMGNDAPVKVHDSALNAWSVEVGEFV